MPSALPFFAYIEKPAVAAELRATIAPGMPSIQFDFGFRP
jgi:hypothetical protein